MTYALEKITPEDKEKILQDASLDAAKKADLMYMNGQHLDNPSMTWAVDRSRNCYMFYAPTIVRQETMRQSYYIFFTNTWYEFYTENNFFNDVGIVGAATLSEPSLTELQNEITAAFAVYGRYGQGPLNKDGISAYSVVPEFQAGV